MLAMDTHTQKRKSQPSRAGEVALTGNGDKLARAAHPARIGASHSNRAGRGAHGKQTTHERSRVLLCARSSSTRPIGRARRAGDGPRSISAVGLASIRHAASHSRAAARARKRAASDRRFRVLGTLAIGIIAALSAASIPARSFSGSSHGLWVRRSGSGRPCASTWPSADKLNKGLLSHARISGVSLNSCCGMGVLLRAGRNRRPRVFGVDQLGPDVTPVGWAKVAAGDAENTFDAHAVVRGDRTFIFRPLPHHRRRCLDACGQFGLAASLVYCRLNCFHARILAMLGVQRKPC